MPGVAVISEDGQRSARFPRPSACSPVRSHGNAMPIPWDWEEDGRWEHVFWWTDAASCARNQLLDPSG